MRHVCPMFYRPSKLADSIGDGCPVLRAIFAILGLVSQTQIEINKTCLDNPILCSVQALESATKRLDIEIQMQHTLRWKVEFLALARIFICVGMAQALAVAGVCGRRRVELVGYTSLNHQVSKLQEVEDVANLIVCQIDVI